LAGIGREQSRGEEIANSVSHGVGLVAAAVAVPLLMVAAVRHGDAITVVGASVFAAAMVLLYLTSTLYHALPRNRAKRFFHMLDHGAIFLMIAGTYTPFVLIKMDNAWGLGLLAVVWGMAAIGIAIKLFAPRFLDGLSTALYLVQGWAVVAAWEPLQTALSSSVLTLLMVGGVLYTVGVVFHLWNRLPYQNAIWHGFVLSAASCHYAAVIGVVQV